VLRERAEQHRAPPTHAALLLLLLHKSALRVWLVGWLVGVVR